MSDYLISGTYERPEIEEVVLSLENPLMQNSDVDPGTGEGNHGNHDL